MTLKQNDREHLLNMMDLGTMTADQANVAKVRMQRVQLVIGRIPATVRRALNAAVTRGELGHMKKAGQKPEVYYHPNFEAEARSARNTHERNARQAIARVAG